MTTIHNVFLIFRVFREQCQIQGMSRQIYRAELNPMKPFELPKAFFFKNLFLRYSMIVRRVKRGLDLPAIADALDMDQETIRPIWEAVREAAPEYDQDEILRKVLGEK